jgi:hypothetical protein
MNGKGPDTTQFLTCWKDIANYLGKSVRTVQRWEQEFGLPVRRPNGIHNKSAVLAHAGELDAWLGSQWSERRPKNGINGESRLRMAQLVQISRELRSTHMILMEETSAALELLVQNCKQLDTTRLRKDAPPPGGGFVKGFSSIPFKAEAHSEAKSSQYES